MNMLNHSIASNGKPILPPNGSGPQDLFHQIPLSQSLKPFHPNSSKTVSPITTSHKESSISHILSDTASAVNIEFEPLALHFIHPPSENNMVTNGQNVAVLRVTVSSAVKLDETQNELIARKLQRLTGFKNLRIENIVDASLIAGFLISYGIGDSHVIDLSVKGQLAAIAAKIESSDKRRTANNGPSWSFSK